MARHEDRPPSEQSHPGEGPRRPPTRRCPHCGRVVARDPADAAPVFRCPACGLEIKERHLA